MMTMDAIFAMLTGEANERDARCCQLIIWDSTRTVANVQQTPEYARVSGEASRLRTAAAALGTVPHG